MSGHHPKQFPLISSLLSELPQERARIYYLPGETGSSGLLRGIGTSQTASLARMTKADSTETVRAERDLESILLSMAAAERQALDKIIQALTLSRTEDGWAGEMPADVWGPVVFGGFVIAHAVSAVTQDAPVGRRMHSLHAYFLKPVMGGKSIGYRVRTLREGRAFTSRLVEGTQDGQLVLSMMCSFTSDIDGYEYQPSSVPIAPTPEDIAPETFGPWLCAVVGPSARDENGHYVSTHRMWFRTASPLPDDEDLACAFTAFASDMTWKGARPLHLGGDTRGIVSLDHTVWFHRPMRPDDWCYYDVTSVVNTGGRGLVRGQMFSRDGLLCASVSQETRLTRYKETPSQ